MCENQARARLDGWDSLTCRRIAMIHRQEDYGFPGYEPGPTYESVELARRHLQPPHGALQASRNQKDARAPHLERRAGAGGFGYLLRTAVMQSHQGLLGGGFGEYS